MATAPTTKPAASTTAAPGTTAAPAKTAEVAETKSDKFRRLGNARLSKLLDQFDNLANLADHRNYEWTAEQSVKILAAVDDKRKALEKALNAPKGETKSAAPVVSIL